MTKSDDLGKIREVHICKVLGLPQEGRRVSVRCIFHNEKSPSMVIYPDGSYYCYGCAKHGQNAIDFLMEAGATFPEAIDELRKFI